MRYTLPTTREQRVALKRLFDKTPLKIERRPLHRTLVMHEASVVVAAEPGDKLCTYREFRKVCGGPYHRTDAYVGVNWCGMFVGIEKDGYTHT